MPKRSIQIRAANWQSSFLYQSRRFSKYKFRVHFSNVTCTKTRSAHSYFLYEDEITSALPFNVFSPWGPIWVCSFRGSVFSQVCTSGLPVNLEFILAQYTQLNDTTQNSNRHTNQLATALELHILPHYF